MPFGKGSSSAAHPAFWGAAIRGVGPLVQQYGSAVQRQEQFGLELLGYFVDSVITAGVGAGGISAAGLTSLARAIESLLFGAGTFVDAVILGSVNAATFEHFLASYVNEWDRVAQRATLPGQTGSVLFVPTLANTLPQLDSLLKIASLQALAATSSGASGAWWLTGLDWLQKLVGPHPDPIIDKSWPGVVPPSTSGGGGGAGGGGGNKPPNPDPDDSASSSNDVSSDQDSQSQNGSDPTLPSSTNGGPPIVTNPPSTGGPPNVTNVSHDPVVTRVPGITNVQPAQKKYIGGQITFGGGAGPSEDDGTLDENRGRYGENGDPVGQRNDDGTGAAQDDKNDDQGQTFNAGLGASSDRGSGGVWYIDLNTGEKVFVPADPPAKDTSGDQSGDPDPSGDSGGGSEDKPAIPYGPYRSNSNVILPAVGRSARHRFLERLALLGLLPGDWSGGDDWGGTNPHYTADPDSNAGTPLGTGSGGGGVDDANAPSAATPKSGPDPDNEWGAGGYNPHYQPSGYAWTPYSRGSVTTGVTRLAPRIAPSRVRVSAATKFK